MNTQSNIVDVLSGKESVKVQAGISTESIIILGATILFVIIVGKLITKQLD